MKFDRAEIYGLYNGPIYGQILGQGTIKLLQYDHVNMGADARYIQSKLEV